MFMLQVALLKAPGGVETAVGHYERMFKALGPNPHSAIVFRGPSAAAFHNEGFDLLIPPPLLSAPWAANVPFFDRLRHAVRARMAKGEPLAILVHSDMALARMRCLFPESVIIAPCHSDKIKHKNGANLVLTLNPHQQQFVQAALPRARVRELGNPYSPRASQSRLASAAPAGRDIRLNFVGRFEGFKDPLTLISAFEQAKLSPGIELRLIGAGRMEKDVHRAVAHSSRKITLTGWLDEPFASFHSGDVLVLPSLWESYSYVIREALDLGVPVIASDIHVHRTALADGAFGELFPPGDRQALAAAIERSVEDLPRLREMAANGGIALRARYSPAPFWKALRTEIEWVLATRAE